MFIVAEGGGEHSYKTFLTINNKKGFMKNLESLSAVKLIKAIKKKQISSLDLLDYYIERYKRLNPKINAIVATDFDKARIRACKLDNALARGENCGPLHGLPVTIKDVFEVAGMPATYGSPIYKDFIPDRNADVVQSLLDGGAVVFGKTNTPIFANDWQSYNKVYGVTNNPWDVTKTPGGSSGGAAAALAAGLTGLEIGSDLGGSIRIPAHFCGVFAHKPSYGIVSRHPGNKPWDRTYNDYSIDIDLAVNGPLGRSAEDLKLAMDAIGGPPSYQRKAFKIKLPRPRKTRLKDFRVGLWLDDKKYPVDSEIGICLQNMVEQLKKLGAHIKTEKPDIDLHECYMLRDDLAIMTVNNPESQKTYANAIKKPKTLRKNDNSFPARYIRKVTASHYDWKILSQKRIMYRQKCHEYFREFDVLLCPVARVAAFAHDHSALCKEKHYAK